MHNQPAHSSLDWDDLRYVLAVARAGSLSGAARALSVTHSTMLRRIDAIEAKLQVRLFERLRSGYVPTEAGEAMRQTAEQCEPLVAEAERRIIGRDTQLHGRLRITTTPLIAHSVLPAALAAFCGTHPDIEVELSISLARADLARRDADVALRMGTQVPDYLIGRQLGVVRFRIYGWRGTAVLAGLEPGRLYPAAQLASTHKWISFERDVADFPSNRWLEANVAPSQVAIRVDHFPATLSMLATGIGIGMLPEVMAQGVPQLVALSEPIAQMDIPLWILTHPDLRNTARVRAFMQDVGGALSARLA